MNIPFSAIRRSAYLFYKKKGKNFERKVRSRFWRRSVEACVDGIKLDQNQIKAIKTFYGSFDTCFKVTPLFHSFYMEKTGRFDIKYIPDDIYYCYVDSYFNNWEKALTIDNKCLYPRLFSGIKQPIIVATRMNNIWTDSKGILLDEEALSSVIESCGEVVVKQACESEGGKNIYFISGDCIAEQVFAATKKISKDIVVQKVIKQHEELSRLNPSSINTVRFLSFLSQEGVKIYSAVIRMGINGSRVDNASSGGITCGIKSDGSLKKVAYSAKGDKYDSHPTSGLNFDSVKIPSYDKACELVRRTHPFFPDFRLVSWDIAIGEDAEPILIEANLRYGELDFHQLNNGPVFGEDTEKILNEVFGK